MWFPRNPPAVDSLRFGPPQARSARVQVPGDKSITHRALLLGALAQGTTLIAHPNRGADALTTATALRQLGVRLQTRSNAFIVRGATRLRDPRGAIDCGNSGTSMRLLLGMLAGRVNAVLTGDSSLRRRPMERVATPLRAMGAAIATTRGKAPVRLARRDRPLRGISYALPIASAQLKSALLLAGLRASGKTVLTGDGRSRDHTERMLRAMGAEITVRASRISLAPSALRSLERIDVPGDFSAAFYLIAAAATLPGMRLRLPAVGLNPTRTAALTVLQTMGGDVVTKVRNCTAGEPAGEVIIRGGAPLRGVAVPHRLVPNLLDEIPALCALAATATGTFSVRGARELKVKESDRIRTTVQLLRSFGVHARALADGIVVKGGQPLRAPRRVSTHGDHRIGMAAAILAVAARAPIVIGGAACIATSFPGFARTWRATFGARRKRMR